jgi:oligopeptidase B
VIDERQAVDAFLDEVLGGRLSRRQVAQRAVALGLSLPVLATLLRERAGAVQAEPTPPDAPRQPHIYVTPLGPAVDPYRWLENPDDPAVIAYLEAENAYTEEVMGPTAELQEALYQELTSRVQRTDTGVPVSWRGYLYYSRTEEGKDYQMICRRRDIPDAAEEVLLDLNTIAGDYLAVGSWRPSP